MLQQLKHLIRAESPWAPPRILQWHQAHLMQLVALPFNIHKTASVVPTMVIFFATRTVQCTPAHAVRRTDGVETLPPIVDRAVCLAAPHHHLQSLQALYRLAQLRWLGLMQPL